MMVGKILCYPYLSPERLANEGSLLSKHCTTSCLPQDEAKPVGQAGDRSTGSDADRQKLQERCVL